MKELLLQLGAVAMTCICPSLIIIAIAVMFTFVFVLPSMDGGRDDM